jgi:hypothetical protein
LPLHATNQHHLHHMLNAPIPVWEHNFLTCIIILYLTGEEDGSSWCNKGGWQPATNKGWVQLGLDLIPPSSSPHLHGPGFIAIQVLVGKVLHWIGQSNAIYKTFYEDGKYLQVSTTQCWNFWTKFVGQSLSWRFVHLLHILIGIVLYRIIYSHSTEIFNHRVFCQMWIVMYMGSASLKLLVAT